MTKKPEEAPPEIQPPTLPSAGGTYVRTPDGSLVPVGDPQPAHDAPVKED